MNYERKKINLLIGISGSVACIKYLDLIQAFLKNEAFFFSIKLIATQNSCFFLSEEDKKSKKIVIENEEIPIFFDEDEWHWKKKGDPILHIELRKWADIFLIAPLSANTMGKISNGLCDNLLTSVARAWDFRLENPINGKYDEILDKPFIVAPAMNTCMYEHPITEKQIKKLKKLKIVVLNTIKKELVCGDVGYGAMEEVGQICKSMIEILQKKKDK